MMLMNGDTILLGPFFGKLGHNLKPSNKVITKSIPGQSVILNHVTTKWP